MSLGRVLVPFRHVPDGGIECLPVNRFSTFPSPRPFPQPCSHLSSCTTSNKQSPSHPRAAPSTAPALAPTIPLLSRQRLGLGAWVSPLPGWNLISRSASDARSLFLWLWVWQAGSQAKRHLLWGQIPWPRGSEAAGGRKTAGQLTLARGHGLRCPLSPGSQQSF